LEVLINKLVFISKKVEVMVKEKIAMLMSMLGLKPVLSHNLLIGLPQREFYSLLNYVFYYVN